MNDKQPENTEKARVLLVDDKPENLRLLAEMLTERYHIQIARSGEQAIRTVHDHLPDIVLLDVNMPGTDGFEVCQQLKEEPSTRPVPIIFITALAKTEEKVRGLQLGGVDYITKPFQIEEVVARLETHLELKRLRDALAEKVAYLEDCNGRLNLFARALAHDLRGPLGTVLGMSDLLLLTKAVEGDSREQLALIRDGAVRMQDIIQSLLLLATAERADSQCGMLDVNESLEAARQGLAGKIEESGCRFLVRQPLPGAFGKTEWIERVWTNLISNAIKYGGEPPEVTVGADEASDGEVRFWVEDNGAGLSPEQKSKLFTAFHRLHQEKADGIGLGLVIVRKIVEQMGGCVGVEDAWAGGSRFSFTLPASGEVAAGSRPIHSRPTKNQAGKSWEGLPF